METFTVSLELPECVVNGYDAVAAVEEFIAQATASPHLWVYNVEAPDGRKFMVDMGMGGTVIETGKD